MDRKYDWGGLEKQTEPLGSLFDDAEHQQKESAVPHEPEQVGTMAGFTEEMTQRGARALFDQDQRRTWGPGRDTVDHRIWARVEKDYMRAAEICLTAALGGRDGGEGQEQDRVD